MDFKDFTQVNSTTQKSGIAVGFDRGHVTTRREARSKVVKPRRRTSEKKLFARKLIGEITGLAPYEKKILELVNNSMDKRARKYAKARLGTFRRAKRKVEKINEIAIEMKRTA